MSAMLKVSVRCPEISPRPLVMHLVDLDKVEDGNADIFVDRDFLVAVGDIARWSGIDE